MDGAFISYHNCLKTFGFEYVKIQEIEWILFKNQFLADYSFFISSQILTTILDELIEYYKDEDFEFLKIGYIANYGFMNCL